MERREAVISTYPRDKPTILTKGCWRNSSVSVLHTEGRGAEPLRPTKITMKCYPLWWS
jgi:hypothetical protein